VNGCPVRLTDTRGALVWSAQYTAWGEAIGRGLNGFDQPLRLQGQQLDAETGLHYNRHRYYDTVAGQFVCADPLGLAPGENTYGFANNAIRWVDPLGLHSTPVPYGGDDLSQMAQIYRMDNGITGGRNVAVFEYLDGNGMPNYITAASGNGLHAERVIANQIRAAGIDPNRVTRVYTELAPCPGIRGMQYCGQMLGSNFPSATVTHSFEYGADRTSRRQGVKSLKAAVKRLFTCS
jgi:RHS repeat-associated protein